MGCNTTKEDKLPLLDDGEEILPIFPELRLVLIGHRGAGKNTVANAILGGNVFKFWTSHTSYHIKKTRRVSGRLIHLTRTPGWSGELSRSKKTKLEIVHCVQTLYDTGPHAVLLVLKVESVVSVESTVSTLESLLTHRLWDHTIVVFTHGEKLRHYSIEDYIRSEQLKPLIDKCGRQYFVLQNDDGNQITEIIEDFVARKNSTSCFILSAQTEDNNTLLSECKQLVERIKSKITSLSAFIEQLKLNLKPQNNESHKKRLKSKDNEIKILNTIVQEKEKEIERLQLALCQASSNQSTLQEKKDDLVYQLDMKSKENERLKKELKEKDAMIETLRKQLNKMDNEIEKQPQMTQGSVLHEWGVTLINILNELTDDHLKKLKDLMRWSKEWAISRNSTEGKDRGELVDLIIEKWGERQSVLKMRDLMKKIPRNDNTMTNLFKPFLEEIGETW